MSIGWTATGDPYEQVITQAQAANANSWNDAEAVRLAAANAPASTNSQTTDPFTGWAGQQGYNPAQAAALIWDNPFAIVPQVFGNENMYGTPGYNTLRNLNFDPLTMYVIGQGANSSMTSAGADDYINWLRDMYLNYGTAGGRAFNSRELLGRMEMGANNRETALGEALAAGDSSTQVRTAYNMLSDIYNAGMNPVTASALRAGVAREGDRYLGQAMRTDADTGVNAQNFAAWLRQNAPHLYGR